MATTRAIFGVLLGAALAAAQPSPDLAALQKTAEAKTAEWDGLARTLESKLVRMLPCDARVRTSIEEVSRASDARIAALSQYLEAAAAQTAANGKMIAQAIAAQEAMGREIESERAEADQVRIAIDAQLADLSDSLKRRATLSEAHKTLGSIAAMVQQRVADAQQQGARRTALLTALRELEAANQAEEKAIRTEISALILENTRWTEYYTARIARAQTECSITNQAPPERPQRAPQRKKK